MQKYRDARCRGLKCGWSSLLNDVRTAVTVGSYA